MNEEIQIQNRITFGRCVFTFFFLALFLRFFLQTTPSGMLQPVLFRYNFDFTYWLLDLLGIYEIVLGSRIGSIIFDFLLLSSCILCILYPLYNYFAVVFGTLFLIYVLSYNAAIVHHSHPLALMSLASVPFFFKSHIVWKYLWEGFRYYVCYSYFISFIWKSFIGKSLLFWNMGYVSTKANLVEYLFFYPDTLMSSVFSFFLMHPVLLNLGLIFIFLIEGIMVVGFFTKKWDKVLLFISIIIHSSTYFFADVYFFEMLVGVFAFLTLKDLKKFQYIIEIGRHTKKVISIFQKT